MILPRAQSCTLLWWDHGSCMIYNFKIKNESQPDYPDTNFRLDQCKTNGPFERANHSMAGHFEF